MFCWIGGSTSTLTHSQFDKIHFSVGSSRLCRLVAKAFFLSLERDEKANHAPWLLLDSRLPRRDRLWSFLSPTSCLFCALRRLSHTTAVGRVKIPNDEACSPACVSFAASESFLSHANPSRYDMRESRIQNPIKQRFLVSTSSTTPKQGRRTKTTPPRKIKQKIQFHLCNKRGLCISLPWFLIFHHIYHE